VHDGYLIYEYEGGLLSAGGTSFSTPSFAGLMALVNQKAGGRQGLPNPVLYALASHQASGGANVFNELQPGITRSQG
jgi:subtilase family serine protease